MENYAKTVAFANVVYDEVVPITAWIERYYEHGQHLVLECMQQPGDIIFVPHGYMHAVVNTKDSIGIANQVLCFPCSALLSFFLFFFDVVKH